MQQRLRVTSGLLRPHEYRLGALNCVVEQCGNDDTGFVDTRVTLDGSHRRGEVGHLELWKGVLI
jgi:hypothetical protein